MNGVSNTELIQTFLAENPGKFYCNSCLSHAARGSTVSEVIQITRPWRKLKVYRAGKVLCWKCNADRECITYG